MTTTPPEAPPPPHDPSGGAGPRVTGDQVRDLGRLRRSRSDRKVAGVAGGLARHLDVDPLILRVAFVVLVFFGGAGLILYGACWLLVPEDGAERATVNLDERSRTVALVVAGVIAVLALVGDSWGAFWFPWPVALIALVALWLLTRNNPQPTPPTYPPTAPGPSAATTAATPTAHPAPAAPQATWAPPPAYTPSTYAMRVPNPRKRGPMLFWPTLALLALGEGILGMVDLGGVDVAPAAYPALAVAICGAVLVLGAYFGRAGGVILLGLISAVALAGTTAADHWDGNHVRVEPTSASALDQRYWLGTGEQVIDLTGITDPQALDGHTLVVEGGAGRIEVIVPSDMTVDVDADIDGPGHIALFGQETGGIGVQESKVASSPGDPRLSIDAHLGVGEIEVTQR